MSVPQKLFLKVGNHICKMGIWSRYFANEKVAKLFRVFLLFVFQKSVRDIKLGLPKQDIKGRLMQI